MPKEVVFPEIRIEEVFKELYAKKGIKADDALAVHTGQFFRVLTMENKSDL